MELSRCQLKEKCIFWSWLTGKGFLRVCVSTLPNPTQIQKLHGGMCRISIKSDTKSGSQHACVGSNLESDTKSERHATRVCRIQPQIRHKTKSWAGIGVCVVSDLRSYTFGVSVMFKSIWAQFETCPEHHRMVICVQSDLGSVTFWRVWGDG